MWDIVHLFLNDGQTFDNADTTNTNLKVSLSVSRHYSYADRLNCNLNITAINLSRCEFNYFIKCIGPIGRARVSDRNVIEN